MLRVVDVDRRHEHCRIVCGLQRLYGPLCIGIADRVLYIGIADRFIAASTAAALSLNRSIIVYLVVWYRRRRRHALATRISTYRVPLRPWLASTRGFPTAPLPKVAKADVRTHTPYACDQTLPTNHGQQNRRLCAA